MLELIKKLYIKSEDFNNIKNREKLVKATGLMGLSINLILFLIKIIIGIFINSIAIISDSINNLTDSLTSIATIIGSKMANKPSDKEHPYGHGRLEYVISMLVGLFIIMVGVELFKTSLENILNPQEIKFSKYTIIILIFSIALKLYMYLYNKKAYKWAKSLFNKTIYIDSLNDVFATTLVFTSIIVNYLFKINIDGGIGLLISLVVLKSGIEIFFEIGNILVGKEIDDKKIDDLKNIILEEKYLKNVHSIEIHEYGIGRLQGSCHVDIPANIDTYTMHKILNEVEKRVYEKLNIRLSIHADPVYLLEKDEFNKVSDEDLKIDIDEWRKHFK